jgi:hypothetical protein
VAKSSRSRAAVFVEHSQHKKPVRAARPPGSAPSAQQESPEASDTRDSTGHADEQMVLESYPKRTLKRPGKRSVVTTRAPPSFPRPPAPTEDKDMDRLAQEMHEYTLKQIGCNIAKQERERQQEADFQWSRNRDAPVPASLRATHRSTLRPKPPGQRWAERNPEDAAALNIGADGEDASENESDEEDYVMETYCRVPESALVMAIPPEQVGLLVLDTAPDADYFFGNGSDDEEEAQDDYDEDENGEYRARPLRPFCKTPSTNAISAKLKITTRPTIRTTKWIRTTSMIETRIVTGRGVRGTQRSLTSVKTSEIGPGLITVELGIFYVLM